MSPCAVHLPFPELSPFRWLGRTYSPCRLKTNWYSAIIRCLPAELRSTPTHPIHYLSLPPYRHRSRSFCALYAAQLIDDNPTAPRILRLPLPSPSPLRLSQSHSSELLGVWLVLTCSELPRRHSPTRWPRQLPPRTRLVCLKMLS